MTVTEIQPETPYSTERFARKHASLPEGWTRNRLLNLVQRVGRYIGLNATDLSVLQRISDNTPNEHYQSRVRSPICFERQIDMAEDLGITSKQLRRIESKLHRLNLIRRDTAANGYRGGRYDPDGRSAQCGLSMEPLIERLDELLVIEAQIKHDAELATQYRAEISILRRRLILALNDLGDHPLSSEIVTAKASWPRPRAISSLEKLDQHFFDLSELWKKAHQILTPCRTKMSGAADTNVRRHIHNTTDKDIDNCNDPSFEASQIRPADMSADISNTNATPDGAANCLEKSIEAEPARATGDFIEKLTTRQFFSLTSEDMRLYLTGSGPSPSFAELDYAVTMRMRDLGVNVSAWNEAVEAMGWPTALLSMIVIDRNTTRAENPVRNAGAMLRAFARKHQTGDLNLSASLYGIWNRSTEEETLH